MAVYLSNMAPIGVKLWENVFQTIPDISFFDFQTKIIGDLCVKTFGIDFFIQESCVLK